MAKEKKSNPSVEEVLKALRKEVAVGALQDFDRIPDAYSTGNLALDFRTECGGYPKGRIVEQYGPKSSGKTTSALQALAIEQKKCKEAGSGVVLFLDFEKAIDENYCKALGIDVADPTFIYAEPNTFEEGAKILRSLLETGELRIAVLDSVAAMITESESEVETGMARVADRAKMLHQLCRQITPVLARTDATVIFLNHMMVKVDTTAFGQKMAAQGIKQTTKPGGEALNFYASLIIEFKQIKHLSKTTVDPLTNESTKIATQTETKAKIVKNKVGNPQGEVLLRIRYGKGFSQAYSALQVLVGHEVVTKNSTGYYTFPADLVPPSFDEKKFHGEDGLLSKIEENPEWLDLLVVRAKEILNSAGDLFDNASGEEFEDEGDVVE